jgi:hypothetical protein
MKSFKNFVTENISKEDAKRLQRMKSANPEQMKNLQANLESTREAAKRISSGETRTTETGQSTRTKPSARNVTGELDARRTDPNLDPKLRDAANRRLSGQPEEPRVGRTRTRSSAAQRARASGQFRTQNPVSRTQPSSGLSDLNKAVDDVKPPVTTRRGSLSREVAPILRDLRRQGNLETRMSAGYDATVAKRGEEALKQIRSDSKPTTTSQLIKQTQQKPLTAPKPPTVTQPTLPKVPSTTKFNQPGVEVIKLGSRTYRGPSALVNKPAPVTAADVTRTTKRAVTNTTRRAAIDAARKLKTGLRVAGVVGAGLEAAGEFKRRKDMGQDTATAAAGSGTRAVGGAVGAKLAAGTAAKVLSPLAVAPFPGARPLYALGVGAAGIAGYTGGADAATRGFDYVKKNFKGFQDKANKAYQRLLLPQYRTKTEEFVPEEAEFTVEFVQRLKDFSRPVTNNPVVKAVTKNPFVRGAGRVLGGLERAVLTGTRAAALYNLASPETRPSQKVNSAITAFAPPGIAHASVALTPSIDNSKFIRKNIDEPIMRTNKKIDRAVGQHPKPGSGKTPNYARLYRDMQTRGMPMF